MIHRFFLSFLLGLLCSWAGALDTIEKSVVIVLDPSLSPALRTETCASLRASILEWNFHTQQAAPCRIDRGDLTQIPNLGFVIEVSEFKKADSSKALKLSLQALQTRDEHEPKILRWEILQNERTQETIQKILKKYSQFDAEKRNLKKVLLVSALTESSSVTLNAQYQVVEKSSGQVLSFDEAYDRFLRQNQKNRNYIAAGLEIAASLGLFTALYYSTPDDTNVNNEDWDYTIKNSFKARFANGDAIRFDDNAFTTNRNHLYAGASYYGIAREAGLSRMESLLVTAAASSTWEFFSEYREVVSINDQINTTLGGFVIGEALHQVLKIFEAGSNTGMNRILKSIFQSPRKMSNWLENKVRPGSSDIYSQLESKPDIWGRLDFYAASTRAKNGGSGRSYGFSGQVYNIPLFEEPGRVQKLLLDDTVYSKFTLESGSGPDLEMFRMYAKTTLAAIYSKNLGQNSKGQLQGYNLIVGPSLGTEIYEDLTDRNLATGKDEQALVHVMGATVDMTIYHQGTRIHCILDLYGDFAMMRSFAFEKEAQLHGTSGVQSVLARRGYYYGVGSTQSLSLVINRQKWEVGAQYQTSRTSMINSRTRFYESEDPQQQASDQIQTERVWLAYQLNADLRLEAGLERIKRNGRMNSTEVSETDLRKYGKLIYSYR